MRTESRKSAKPSLRGAEGDAAIHLKLLKNKDGLLRFADAKTRNDELRSFDKIPSFDGMTN